MYGDTIEGFTKVAEKKLAFLRRSPGGFLVASMLAGAYVGVGIMLIFTLGAEVPTEIAQAGDGRDVRHRADARRDRRSGALHRSHDVHGCCAAIDGGGTRQRHRGSAGA